MPPHRHKQKKWRARPSISTARVAVGILAFVLTFILVIWVLLDTAPVSVAADRPFDSLRSVSVLEMPDRAVSLVQVGDPAGVDERIRESLGAVSVLARPGLMPCLVASLARRYPDHLAVILDTALDLQPDQVLVFARASATQLPGRVEEISYLVGRKSPWNASAIAKTLAEQTTDPDAIVRGLKRGIPEYNPRADLLNAPASTNVPTRQ